MAESLSTMVKASIDAWAEHLRTQSPLVRAAQQGELGSRSLALYLESLRYVFARSHANIVAAAERAQALQLPELCAYFRDKAAEEIGHDQWASNDLAQLPSRAVDGIRPAAASVAAWLLRLVPFVPVIPVVSTLVRLLVIIPLTIWLLAVRLLSVWLAWVRLLLGGKWWSCDEVARLGSVDGGRSGAAAARRPHLPDPPADGAGRPGPRAVAAGRTAAGARRPPRHGPAGAL